MKNSVNTGASIVELTVQQEKKRSTGAVREPISVQNSCALCIALLIGLLIVSAPVRLNAQGVSRFDAGVDYNFVHTNAPPGECGCFSMQGGDAWLGWHFTDHLSVVGQGGVQYASKINGTTASLTLISYLAGPRVTFRHTHRFVPFAQALLGGAHASGLLTPSQTTGLSGTANAFAVVAGGGLDIRLTRHFDIRPVDAGYFFTRFNNGLNDHQNNFRFAAGIVVRF